MHRLPQDPSNKVKTHVEHPCESVQILTDTPGLVGTYLVVNTVLNLTLVEQKVLYETNQDKHVCLLKF